MVPERDVRHTWAFLFARSLKFHLEKDINGQIYDLLRIIFEIASSVATKPVFLFDYKEKIAISRGVTE